MLVPGPDQPQNKKTSWLAWGSPFQCSSNDWTITRGESRSSGSRIALCRPWTKSTGFEAISAEMNTAFRKFPTGSEFPTAWHYSRDIFWWILVMNGLDWPARQAPHPGWPANDPKHLESKIIHWSEQKRQDIFKSWPILAHRYLYSHHCLWKIASQVLSLSCHYNIQKITESTNSNHPNKTLLINNDPPQRTSLKTPLWKDHKFLCEVIGEIEARVKSEETKTKPHEHAFVQAMHKLCTPTPMHTCMHTQAHRHERSCSKSILPLSPLC